VARRLQRLVVVHDDESVAEYPLFYERFVRGQLREEARSGRSVSAFGAENAAGSETGGGGSGGMSGLVVTGELGDQLFGSDMCARAFAPAGAAESDAPSEASTSGALAAAAAAAELDATAAVARHFSKGLAHPWQDTLLPAMNEIGLLAGVRM
jgi:hypothetical protein